MPNTSLSLTSRRGSTGFFFFWLLTLLSCGWVRADDPDRPRVELWTTAAERFTGELLAVESGQLTLQMGDQPQRTPWSSVWQIAMSPAPSRPPRPRFWLHLTNGDRVGVSSVKLSEDQLEFQLPTQELALSLGVEFVAGVQPLRPGTSWKSDESEWFHVAHRSEKSDLVVLRNGDHQAGEVSEVGASGLQISGSLGTQQLEWSAVSGLLLNPELAEIPPTPTEGWVVLLVDDSWLTVSTLETAKDRHLKLTTLQGIEMTIPLSSVRWLTRWGADVVLLSREEISEQAHTPWLGETREVARDRNALGLPLRSDPATGSPASGSATGMLPTLCPLGLGLTSGMTVRWKLEGRFRRFQCSVGLDAIADARGDAVLTVKVDDRPAQSITLRASEPVVQSVSLDLTGAQSLTIETGFGEHADSCDWINLYAPILVR